MMAWHIHVSAGYPETQRDSKNEVQAVHIVVENQPAYQMPIFVIMHKSSVNEVLCTKPFSEKLRFLKAISPAI